MVAADRNFYLPVGPDDHDLLFLDPPAEVEQEVNRRRVSPMEVIEHKDHRLGFSVGT